MIKPASEFYQGKFLFQPFFYKFLKKVRSGRLKKVSYGVRPLYHFLKSEENLPVCGDWRDNFFD